MVMRPDERDWSDVIGEREPSSKDETQIYFLNNVPW